LGEVINILRKYNFWDNQQVKVGFVRLDYLSKLSSFIGNSLIKVITGQRRTGKSYLMRQLIAHLHNTGVNPHNILYINKEMADFDFIRNHSDLHDIIKLYLANINPTGKVFLFFDEIQLVENWEKVINSYSQDYSTEYEVFISGSNSKLLSGELASLITGRYVSFQVYPYSFSEYCNVSGKKYEKATFIEYLTGGGLPELFNLPDMETRKNYMQALKDTILLKDIVLRNQIKDASLLELLFTFLVQNISNPVSVQNIVNYFLNLKISTNYNTVSSYIEYIKQTFLMHEVFRYDMKGKKIIGGTRKYYINDLSFRNILFPGFEPGLGYLLENAVFLEFKRNGYDVFTGSERNREIDFVVKKGGNTKYIQVMYFLTDEKVIEREFGNLESIKDNFEKMVISLDDVSLGNRRGIIHYPAWDMEIYK
jgi:predicted AAA+ superfamily ATPase